jgi:hypothetical protein
VRKGKISQRFEIRHGDCGFSEWYSECQSDRSQNIFNVMGLTLVPIYWVYYRIKVIPIKGQLQRRGIIVEEYYEHI